METPGPSNQGSRCSETGSKEKRFCKSDCRNMVPKAPYDYPASFWTSDLSISLWEARKVIIFIMFGPSGRVHVPQNQLDLAFGDSKLFQLGRIRIPKLFLKTASLGKDACRANPEIHLRNSWKSCTWETILEYGMNVRFSRTPYRNFWQS